MVERMAQRDLMVLVAGFSEMVSRLKVG